MGPIARFEPECHAYGVIGLTRVDQSSTMRATIAYIRSLS